MHTGKTTGLPELMRFLDGTPVESEEQWARRRREILGLFETAMYGQMPEAAREKVEYRIRPGDEKQIREMEITVRRKGKEASFTVLVTLPEQPVPGTACFLEYCPFFWSGKRLISPNSKIAAGRGYAAIQYDPTAVASDDDHQQGDECGK